MSRALATVAILAFGGLAAVPAGATAPGANGQLAWQREIVNRPPDLWVGNPDGTAQRKVLSRRGDVEAEPAWSPTASETLAFTRETRSHPPEIYLGDLGTNRIRRLTRHRAISTGPAFSPDGRSLAYSTDTDFAPPRDPEAPPAPPEIYVVDTDGSDRKRLTRDRLLSLDPDWSPDGQQIIFEEARFVRGELQNRIAIIDADGRNRRALTRFGGARELDPRWMPDGQRIVFEAERSGRTRSDILIMRADGSDVRDLLATSAFETDPVPSPDGTRIAFTSDRDRRGRVRRGPGFEVYTMALDGTGVTRLTNNRSPDLFPDWQRLP